MIPWSVHVLFLEAVLEIGRIDLEPILRVAPVCQYIGHHQRQKGYLSCKCHISAISPFFRCNRKHENCVDILIIGLLWYLWLLKQRKLDFPGVSRNLLRGEQLVSLVETPDHNQSNILKLNLTPDIILYLVCKNEKMRPSWRGSDLFLLINPSWPFFN